MADVKLGEILFSIFLVLQKVLLNVKQAYIAWKYIKWKTVDKAKQYRFDVTQNKEFDKENVDHVNTP
jgi:hypothetical protein